MKYSNEDLKNLILDLPNDIDREKFYEYKTLRESNKLSDDDVFKYFIYFYNVEYVYNPKQIRRSYINMDSLYMNYKNDTSFYARKIKLNSEYTYIQNFSNEWILIDGNPKGFFKDRLWNHDFFFLLEKQFVNEIEFV